MAKKARKHRQKMDYDAFDVFDDSYDDDFDLRETSADYHGDDEWGADENKFTARRKIERRRDLKRLYSQLDEWEEFGSRVDW